MKGQAAVHEKQASKRFGQALVRPKRACMHGEQAGVQGERESEGLDVFLRQLGEAAARLLRGEEDRPPPRRVNGAWYDYLPLAAKEGAVLLEEHGEHFAGLGCDAEELRGDPDRLRVLMSARAGVVELLERLDRVILFYKERIARRSRALRRSVEHKLADEGVPQGTRAALRDGALPFLRLFEAHNALREAHRQETLRARRRARALLAAGGSRESDQGADDGERAGLLGPARRST